MTRLRVPEPASVKRICVPTCASYYSHFRFFRISVLPTRRGTLLLEMFCESIDCDSELFPQRCRFPYRQQRRGFVLGIGCNSLYKIFDLAMAELQALGFRKPGPGEELQDLLAFKQNVLNSVAHLRILMVDRLHLSRGAVPRGKLAQGH